MNATDSKPCDCWTQKNKALESKGYILSRKLITFTMGIDSMDLMHLLPIERLDGKRLKRNEPSGLKMTYCPFCGSKL